MSAGVYFTVMYPGDVFPTTSLPKVMYLPPLMSTIHRFLSYMCANRPAEQ